MDTYVDEPDLDIYYRRRRLKESGYFFTGLGVLSGIWFVGHQYINWGWQGNLVTGLIATTYTLNYMIFGLPHYY